MSYKQYTGFYFILNFPFSFFIYLKKKRFSMRNEKCFTNFVYRWMNWFIRLKTSALCILIMLNLAGTQFAMILSVL